MNNRIITPDEGRISIFNSITFSNNKGLHNQMSHDQQLKYSFSFKPIIL